MFVIERKDWKKKFMELKDLESDSELMKNYVWNKKRGVAGKNWFCPAGKGRHKRLDAGCAEGGRLSPSLLNIKRTREFMLRINSLR